MNPTASRPSGLLLLGESLLETVCALANEPGLGGGWLLLGVEEGSGTRGDYRVVGIEDPDKLLNDLHSRCANAFNVPVRIQARAEVLEEGTVIVVDVPEADPASRPIHFARKPLPRSAWRRGPNGDYRCTQDDLAELYLGRSGRSHDASVVSGASLEDLDPDAIEHYRDARRAVNPAAEELSFSDPELLEALGAVLRRSGQLQPTVAGVLLFGRRGALRRLFPANRVDYIRIPGKEWIEDPHERFTTLDLRDTLPRLIQRATAAVLDDLPRAFQLPEGELRRDEKTVLPENVVREAVVNAVMHRNYQRQQPIQLLRYSNRLEVQNPGYSLKALENLGEADIAWLGRFRHLELGEDEQRALILLRETGRINNSDYRDLNRVDTLAASQRLAHLRDLGLIEQVPGGAATYYVPGERLAARADEAGDLFSAQARESGALSREPEALSRESGGLPRESGALSRESLLGEVPEALRHQLEMLGQRSRHPGRVEAVLSALCALRPWSLKELAMVTGRNPAYLQHRYLTPMVREGRLQRRFPNEPNRPDQAYIAAEESQ